MSKTFKLNLTFDVKAVLDDELVKDLVERSKAEDAPKFLAALREGSSDESGVLDEEVFIKAALTGILRGKIKGFTAHLIESAGMTGTVSPIRVRDADVATVLHIPGSTVDDKRDPVPTGEAFPE